MYLFYAHSGLLVNTLESALHCISCCSGCQFVQPELRPTTCLRDLLPYLALVLVTSRNSSWLFWCCVDLCHTAMEMHKTDKH